MTARTAAPEAPVKVRRVIVAASIGNALEWFDILVYGFFAATISKLFFPSDDETVSLLLTLGTFAVSYVVRPIGALVLGAYADRAGRKRALMLSIRLMMAATLLIAIMPPYAQIGLLAPIAILLARLVQGFSAGGEFGSATAFLVEHAPEKRGFMASWQFASQGLATLLASAFGTVLTATLSDAQLESWGWRIPFLFGLLIGPVGYYIRRYVDEAGEFVKTADLERAPVQETFRSQKGRMFVAMGALAVSTAISYLITYMPTFAVKELGLPASTGFASTLVTGIVLTGLTPVVGHLSDRFGRTRIMLIFAALILALVYPSFAFLIAAPGFTVILVVMFLVGVLKAGYFAPLPAMMAELFPVTSRATGMAVSYNIGVMTFGGTTPLVIVWLVDATGSKLSLTFYLMLLAVLSLVCVVFARRRLDIP
ncbi:MHS family proline/betaine transporter-like MFS transporter [Saccharopolyspora erythraea NRRL 2338]|uniref:MFS transporter n=2 Tax=Saccharopolyspora erythraea TaxID=1836 RepID=A0ABN1DKU4_SACER|nr:MFS transporter [Saccharopolyspora erythraea]EQD84833.1 membrane protein [Saccharopolyspora erythraea D]PFG95801.1 MHS family proline/betaine transporter-like MFS transporter [Saccharopolyspora erythraea NRRL 2338]QRK92387.1 MFS transporter [Saccharopolyspora erythraea]CAM02060.1 major facilitator superfamily (MFS_1) transporter [Saccharopolyspora erythraea NRRL 2338]